MIRERGIAAIFNSASPDSFETHEALATRIIIDRHAHPARVSMTIKDETVNMLPASARAIANALNSVADIADEAAGRRDCGFAHKFGEAALQQTSSRT